MILANVRARLRGSDCRLVLVALGRREPGARARAEQRLATEGPDGLLDEPGLLEALLALRSLAVPSAALFAYVAVRHALLAADLDDRPLADYLAALLLEFGRGDRANRPEPADDQTYHYLTEIVNDLAQEQGSPERRFMLQAHLGNYALWLAGLFPDFIAVRRARRGGPDLPYYDALGRRGFGAAAEHSLAQQFGVAGIYRTAAERFPAVRQALNRLSDRVMFPNVVTDDRVLRNL
ncbi:MAG TPA: hypothetical protein VLB49_03795 [Gemmatimonadales bacterium]|nr:hypothetical protein [Gemmatimonadales bacterium]